MQDNSPMFVNENKEKALLDTSKLDLSKGSTYDKINLACTFILEQQGKRDSTNTLNGSALFTLVKEAFPEVFPQDFPKNTFIQYLSNTVKDDHSIINCLGRKQGYYLSETAKKSISSELEQKDCFNSDSLKDNSYSATKRVQREILLYPLLESWLVAQGYQAADISSGRALGKWGNPDVAGISTLDTFNGFSIELVTIEAKVTLDNWEQWIFEAVSHRRFANRSYFAFAHPEETINKIPQDMRYYAELYGIGVLVLSMENDKYQKLISLAQTEDSNLELEDIEIIEVFSAPYHFVQPRYQFKFCAALNINCLKDLHLWGRK